MSSRLNRIGAIEFKKNRGLRPHLGERRSERRHGPRTGRLDRSWVTEPGSRFRSAPNGSELQATSDGRILIVDDESAIRMVCRLNLRSAGFETLEAADGQAALAVARAERPDLILLDIMLPEVDGWQVAEELGSEAETAEIPILFLSARSDRTDEARGHELGGVGYITKPFDPSEMIDRVRGALERARKGEREAMRREWGRKLERD
jgi:PleD family two-component response regulator